MLGNRLIGAKFAQTIHEQNGFAVKVNIHSNIELLMKIYRFIILLIKKEVARNIVRSYQFDFLL